MQRLQRPKYSIIFLTTGQKKSCSYNSIIMDSLFFKDVSHKFDLLNLICVTRGRANQEELAVQEKELA